VIAKVGYHPGAAYRTGPSWWLRTRNRLREPGAAGEIAANSPAFASGLIIQWMGRGRMTSPARRRSLPRFARKSILSPIRGLSHIPLGAGRSELEEGLRQISRGTVARWRRSACHLGGGDPLPGVSQVWEHGERLGSQNRRGAVPRFALPRH